MRISSALRRIFSGCRAILSVWSSSLALFSTFFTCTCLTYLQPASTHNRQVANIPLRHNNGPVHLPSVERSTKRYFTTLDLYMVQVQSCRAPTSKLASVDGGIAP